MSVLYIQPGYAARNKSGVVRSLSHKVRSKMTKGIADLSGGVRPDPLAQNLEQTDRFLNGQRLQNLFERIDLLTGQTIVTKIQKPLKIRKRKTIITESENFINSQEDVFSTTDFMQALGIESLSQAVDILRGLSNRDKVDLIKPGVGITNPSLWSKPAVVTALMEKHGVNENRAKNWLVFDYMEKKEIIKKVRLFMQAQNGASSEIQITAILKLKLKQSASALHYLASRGEVFHLRQGTGRVDPGIWIDSKPVKILLEHGLSESEAKLQLLIAYYEKRGWPPMLLESYIEDFVSRQTGAFSILDVADDLGISRSKQGVNILNVLYERGVLVFLWEGGGIYDFHMWSTPYAIGLKTQRGLSKHEAINQLLAEYDEKIFINFIIGKLKDYVRNRLKAFSSSDVTRAWNLTPQQSSLALMGLKGQDTVVLLRAGTSKK